MGKAKKPPEPLTPAQEVALIRQTLHHFTTVKKTRYWLDTGHPELNKVFGSEEFGIPYGKMIEISGEESHGKTATLFELEGMFQKDGAKVAHLDLEDSWDDDWATKRGIDVSQIYPFKPQIGKFGGEKEERMHTAQELFEEIELWMRRRYKENPDGRMFVGIDSIAAILTEDEEEAGIVDQNMRTQVSTASFLSKLLKRWVALIANFNCTVAFVNQLRTAPGVRFGNPEYTTGGRAIRYYSAIRVRARKRGKLKKDGKEIGIKGSLTNFKNKTGQGSREKLSTGFKVFWKSGHSRYFPVSELEDDDNKEK